METGKRKMVKKMEKKPGGEKENCERLKSERRYIFFTQPSRNSLEASDFCWGDHDLHTAHYQRLFFSHLIAGGETDINVLNFSK